MVCKENVVSWFANLSSYKRIDLMCTLLNMCLPFEVRYLGTCVEDLGKRDYSVLRDTECKANSLQDVKELQDISDKRTRRKLALYMSLLHSYNHRCARLLYQYLDRLDAQELSDLLANGDCPDTQVLDELLLLYTLALNHPAFFNNQKAAFANIFIMLQEEEMRLAQIKQESQACKPERLDSPVQSMLGTSSISSNQNIPAPSVIPQPIDHVPQYVVSIPFINHIQPWVGQMVTGNHVIYQPTEVIPSVTSPLLSCHSSPVASRGTSPLGQKIDAQSLPNSTQTSITMSGSTSKNSSSQPSGAFIPSVRQPVVSSKIKMETENEGMKFKGNMQNYVNEPKILLEDPKDLGLKNRTVNGFSQDKKKDFPSTVMAPEPLDTEEVILDNFIAADDPSANVKSMVLPDQAAMYPNYSMTNMVRYPLPFYTATQMHKFPPSPEAYQGHSTCIGCQMSMGPTAGMQNRCARFSPTPLFCLSSPFQAMRIDGENTRHCSHSSSSSTDSRSPPETPPTQQWSTVIDFELQNQHQLQLQEKPRSSKSHSSHRRSHSMVNGVVNTNVSFPSPSSSNLQGMHGFHTHFPEQRGTSSNSGIYSGFPGSSYTKPVYPVFYPGEIMYPVSQYPGHSGNNCNHFANAAAQPYATPAPVLNYPVASQAPTKISCYNCGSNMHLASDCKEQTMEDLTRKGTYSLSFSVPCNNEKS